MRYLENTENNAESSNGRITGSDPVGEGSSPSFATLSRRSSVVERFIGNEEARGFDPHRRLLTRDIKCQKTNVYAVLVKALDVTGVLVHETGGFLSDTTGTDEQTAYRIVWGIEDANKNLVIGSPSSRLVMLNTDATINANVNLTFTSFLIAFTFGFIPLFGGELSKLFK